MVIQVIQFYIQNGIKLQILASRQIDHSFLLCVGPFLRISKLDTVSIFHTRQNSNNQCFHYLENIFDSPRWSIRSSPNMIILVPISNCRRLGEMQNRNDSEFMTNTRMIPVRKVLWNDCYFCWVLSSPVTEQITIE